MYFTFVGWQVSTKRINYQRAAREDLDMECFFMTKSQVRARAPIVYQTT